MSSVIQFRSYRERIQSGQVFIPPGVFSVPNPIIASVKEGRRRQCCEKVLLEAEEALTPVSS